MYEFSFNSVIEHHQQQISNAYPIEDYEYENCIELTLNNSLIQPYNLYVMNITASNPAGRAVIIQDWKLSNYTKIMLNAHMCCTYIFPPCLYYCGWTSVRIVVTS